jgi:hypothetical protein
VRRGREAAATAGELEMTDDEQSSGSEGLLPSTGGEACRHPVRGRTGNGRDDETGPRETAARDLIGAAPTVEVEIGLDPDEQFGVAAGHRAQDGPVAEAQFDAGAHRPGSFQGETEGRRSAGMVKRCRCTQHTVMCSTGPLVLSRTNRSVTSAGARHWGQPTS